MIVVDTSVWIDYFKGVENRQTIFLENALDDQEIIIGDVVLLEILQGIKDENQFRKTKNILGTLTQVQMLSPDLTVEYAIFYRTLRGKGITIRKSNDVIIAGYCIINDLPLLQRDRDFEPFQEHFGLELL